MTINRDMTAILNQNKKNCRGGPMCPFDKIRRGEMFKRTTQLLVIYALMACLCNSVNGEVINKNSSVKALDGAKKNNAIPETWKLSKAYSYKNLTLYMISGKTDNTRKYIPLQEAMKKEQVLVRETGDVNKLTIENVSDFYVFVNAGEIVKGGKQDRVLSMDVILPPKSGKIPIESFCVESGRWQKRGNEQVDKFSGSKAMISSKGLRIASKSGGKNQSAVWSQVSKHQKKLAENVEVYTGKANNDVINSNSSTSLLLTTESDDLKGMMKDYLKQLEGTLGKEPEAIGFIYTINGEINNAEIYSNPDLFKALWGKLINAAVMEAVSEYDKKKKGEQASSEDIQNMFKEALDGKITKKIINKQTEMFIYDSKEYLLFETRDISNDGKWTHLNYILKGDEPVSVLQRGSNWQRSNDLNSNPTDQQQIINRRN